MKQKPKRRKRKHTTATVKRLYKECHELESKQQPWRGSTTEHRRWVHFDGGRRKTEL